MSEQNTPAGWYPDPENSESQRYWDGQTWTEQRTPVQSDNPASVTPTQSGSQSPKKPIHKKWWFWAIVVVLAIGVLGNLGDGPDTVTEEPEEPAAEVVVADEAPEPEPEPEPAPEPEPVVLDPIVYEGTGDDVLDIDKPEGPDSTALLYVRGNDEGRHFAVVGYDQQGDRAGALVNTTDPYEGLTLMDGERRGTTVQLEVSANGPWYFEVRAVASARLVDSPGTVTGSGDDVLRYEAMSSTAQIVGNQAGRHFAVIAYSTQGREGAIVNTTDPYDGRVRIPANTYLLEVTGVGDWEITFE